MEMMVPAPQHADKRIVGLEQQFPSRERLAIVGGPFFAGGRTNKAARIDRAASAASPDQRRPFPSPPFGGKATSAKSVSNTTSSA